MKNRRILAIFILLLFILTVTTSCANVEDDKEETVGWYVVNKYSDELLILPEKELSQEQIQNNDVERYYGDVYMYKYSLSNGAERILYFSDNEGHIFIDFGDNGFRSYKGKDDLWVIEQYKTGDNYCVEDDSLNNQCFKILFVGYVEGIKVS